MNGIAARHLAEVGYPVFPCVPGGKRPITERGFKDATTDLEQVTLWWIKHPEANIGFPTGTTGVVVLDVDDGGQDTLRELERNATTRPETFAVRTGGGGAHFYYCRPDGGLSNSAGRLGPGLDIRGGGGYVLWPPSRTTGPYRNLNTLPIAPFPRWLLDLLRDSKPEVQGSAGPVDLDPIGQPIYRGTRNTTLASIGGSLRARGHNRAEIERYLHEVNAARCRPNLPLGEVARISESISRYAPGRARPAATPEVREALDRLEATILAERWPGMGGATDRGVMVALIAMSRSYGSLIAGGVRVSISHRDLALLAGASLPTTTRALSRLARCGWLSKDNANRKRSAAGAFVLRLQHTDQCAQGLYTLPPVKASGTSVKGLRALRHGTGRLGKKAGQVIETLIRAGGTATLEELEAATGTRRRDLRRRQLSKLREAEIIAVYGDTVKLADGWREALDRERQLTGEIEAERADRRRYETEREAYSQKLREERDADKAS